MITVIIVGVVSALLGFVICAVLSCGVIADAEKDAWHRGFNHAISVMQNGRHLIPVNEWEGKGESENEI